MLANSIQAIAVDQIDADEVLVYIGVSRMGIVSVPFQAGTQPNNGPGFNVGSAHLIKTPGEVWGLEVRPGPGGAAEDCVLLCCDSYGGMRLYGQGLILSNDGETTEEEDQ